MVKTELEKTQKALELFYADAAAADISPATLAFVHRHLFRIQTALLDDALRIYGRALQKNEENAFKAALLDDTKEIFANVNASRKNEGDE